MPTTEQTIITQLLADLESVAPGKVYEWRTSPLDEDENEALNVKDHLNETAEDDEKYHILHVTLEYEAYGEASPAAIRTKAQTIITEFAKIEQLEGVAGARLVSVEKDVEKLDRRYAKLTIETEIYYYKEIWEL